MHLLPSKSMSIICMLCVCVWSFICLHNSMILLSLNSICLCLCPISVSHAYKLYPYIKLGISKLIPSNIPPSFGGFLEPDLSMYLIRCSQPIVCCLYLGSECTGWSDLTELLEDLHVETIYIGRYFI